MACRDFGETSPDGPEEIDVAFEQVEAASTLVEESNQSPFVKEDIGPCIASEPAITGGPGYRPAIWIGRVSGSKNHELGFGLGPQTIDGTWQGELGASEAFDEIAPAEPTRLFEMAVDGIERTETARVVFSQGSCPCDHAVSFQENLGPH